MTATADRNFRFVIFEGDAIAPLPKTEAEIAKALEGRQFTMADVMVSNGQTSSDPVVIPALKVFKYENGTWSSTGKAWEWGNGNKYQIIELPADGLELDKMTLGTGVSGEAPIDFTGEFTYDPAKSILIGAVNKQDKWQIDLKKVNGDACKTDIDCKVLKGATFGLYSTDQSEAMGEAEVKAIGEDVPATKDYNGTTYYLAKTKVSGDDGAVTFDGLNGDKYFVAELKAPSGYGATWAGWKSTKPAGGQNPAATVVKNYGTYILPKSGGIGTAIFTLTGVLLIGGAALALVYRRRNRRDD